MIKTGSTLSAGDDKDRVQSVEDVLAKGRNQGYSDEGVEVEIVSFRVTI